jgi:hypothetical protein
VLPLTPGKPPTGVKSNNNNNIYNCNNNNNNKEHKYTAVRECLYVTADGTTVS